MSFLRFSPLETHAYVWRRSDEHGPVHGPQVCHRLPARLDDKPDSWQGSVEWLAGKISPNVQAVWPAAPVAAITKRKGETMTAWCDVFEDWPLTPSSKDDTAGLAASVAAIHSVLDGRWPRRARSPRR